MRWTPAPGLIIAAGVLTFGVVFSLLELAHFKPEPGQTEVTPLPRSASMLAPTPAVAVDPESFAPRIAPGDVALGVPVGGSEALLHAVHQGDRLDIVASLASPRDGQPLTAVVVRGATVLQPPTNGDPLLVQVGQQDADMVAHLVMAGTHLGFILWPANANADPETPPVLDDRTVRAALGLLAPPTPAPAATAAPLPTSPPSSAVPLAQAATDSGFLYQVQKNDTWESIAAIFGISVDAVRQWNEATNEAPPAPGRLVFIPRS